jgi:hypothetical protein
LALMLQADDLDDLQATHNLEVSIVESAPGDGAPIAKAVMEIRGLRGPITPGPNLQLPLVVPIQPVLVPRTGCYRITASLDSTVIGSYEFEVVKSGIDRSPGGPPQNP